MMKRREFLKISVVAGVQRYLDDESDPEPDSCWSSYGKDLHNSSYAVGERTRINFPHVDWQTETSGPVLSSPSISEESVYVGSWDGCMYSIDANTGIVNWSYETDMRAPVSRQELETFPEDGGVESSPTVRDGRIYFGAYDGYVYCLEASSGEEIWSSKTESLVRSSPAVTSESVYIGDWGGNVYAFCSKEGELLWKRETPYNHIYSTPCYADGLVYFGAADPYEGRGSMLALDEESGEIVWKKELGGEVVSSPVYVNDSVIFGTMDGTVLSLDAESGNVNWRKGGKEAVGSSPATDGEGVYVSGTDGTLYSFDIRNGELTWSFDGDTDFYVSSPSVSESYVSIGGQNGVLYFISTDSGSLLSEFSTGSKVRSIPAVENGSVYFGDWDGNVYRLSTVDVAEIEVSMGKGLAGLRDALYSVLTN